ncbi:hypothetical protein [Virgibacillus dokdonensis]|uniref:hypothetical protein n=1 Tax=Virgibacillus dokdonensis TaxID=302167 RepID=UPI00098B18BC|nr:hypothetical protein [Virgibacillus dokdonensis]
MMEQERIKDFQQLNSKKNDYIQAADVLNYIQYLLLENEMRFSGTRTLGNEKLLPLPHQIEAVYGRMLQVPQTCFLLADDPGAGKTIINYGRYADEGVKSTGSRQSYSYSSSTFCLETMASRTE